MFYYQCSSHLYNIFFLLCVLFMFDVRLSYRRLLTYLLTYVYHQTMCTLTLNCYYLRQVNEVNGGDNVFVLQGGPN